MTELKAQDIVVGLGKTGLSVVAYLRNLGVDCVVVDSRSEPPGLAALMQRFPEVSCYTGAFSVEQLCAASRLIVSPGVALAEPAIQAAIAAGVEVVGDIELFARVADAPIIAITGSNGKSTVTTLLGAMATAAGLSAELGGNLGTPALDLLQRPSPDLYVLELSSFQLETTDSLRAISAVVLNLSEDHMDRYPSLQEYALAKGVVYRSSACAVVNLDDTLATTLLQQQKRSSFSIQQQEGVDFHLLERDGVLHLARRGEPLLAVSEMKIPGRHNQANALAALALGEAAGIPLPGMLSALRTFIGLEHRTQWVAEIDGVNWYNDSKGTNVGAALAAISGMVQPVVLIAGGDGKQADFTPLRAALASNGRAAVLIGRDAPLIEAALQGVVPIYRESDMDTAVQRAAAVAEAGDCVLLSPACASFDMFSGYAERGQRFVEAVRALPV